MTDAITVIRAKRDGQRISDDDIRWLFAAYASGEVADEQMSALLMAIYFNGLDTAELRAWTGAMVDSGLLLDLGAMRLRAVDKHSTGGVGDKVSLILAPLMASCGAAVPQLSGRGLGHTGGTLDKLESIPGWRSALSNEEMLAVLRDVGCVICAAGQDLAPADRRLYALRDVTGTVESIPLIASSIMSKKIAEGTPALVLDVKVGSGAFIQDPGDARLLAETMVTLGAEHGVRTSALLTRMDEPLGRAVGNSVEVEEAVATLSGKGPPDLVEVTLALAEEMLGSPASPPTLPPPSPTAARCVATGTWSRPRAVTRTRSCPGPRAPRMRCTRRQRAGSAGSTPAPSASPPGGSAPGGPGRKTR